MEIQYWYLKNKQFFSTNSAVEILRYRDDDVFCKSLQLKYTFARVNMVFISLNITGNGRVFISINDMMRFVEKNPS